MCKNCKYKGYFANLCKSKNKRPSINFVNDYNKTEICKYVLSEDSWSKNQEACGEINSGTKAVKVTTMTTQY